MIKSEAFVSAQTEIEPPNHPETSQKFVANPLAILYILLLFFGLIVSLITIQINFNFNWIF